MNEIEIKLKEVYILKSRVSGDNRGWFMESWPRRTMKETGLFYNFVQTTSLFLRKKAR